MNGASTAGWSVTVSGLSFGGLDATPTSMIGLSHCLTATWASSTSLVCKLASGDGVLKVGTATVSGIAGTRTATFSYDGLLCFSIVELHVVFQSNRNLISSVFLIFDLAVYKMLALSSSLCELHCRAQRCGHCWVERDGVGNELRVARRDAFQPSELDELLDCVVGVDFLRRMHACPWRRAREGLAGDRGGHRRHADEDLQLRW